MPPEAFAVRESFKAMADLLTNTSNPTLGRETEGNNTLGEVQILTAAAGQIFEVIAANYARQWCRIADQHRFLLAQFGDGGEVKYRKSAEPGLMIQGENGEQIQAAKIAGQVVPAEAGYAFGTISADLLRSDIDFVPSGLTQLGDWQSRLQQSLLIYRTIMESPLVVGGVPIQNPDAALLVLDDVLQKAKCSFRDKLIGSIKQQLQHQALMQQMALQAQMQAEEQVSAEEEAGLAPPPGEAPPGAEGGMPPPEAAAPPAEIPVGAP